MAAKKSAPKKTSAPSASLREIKSQPELIAALKDAGYTLDGFSRKGESLIVRLTPTDLTNDAGGFLAMDVCDAAGLQARCHVYAAVPQDLLILTVKLPDPSAQRPAPNASDPSAQRPAPSASAKPEGSAE